MHLVIKPHPTLKWQIKDRGSNQVSSRKMSLRQAKAIKREALRLMKLVLENEERKDDV